MRCRSLLGIGFCTVFLGGCGFSEVAPPQAPAKEIPKDVEPRTTPPEPGLTRVVLDANGDKATVVEVVDATESVGTASVGGSTATVHGYAETTKPICVAPCVADLKPGMHVLRFKADGDDRMSEANVQVGDRPKVVRHAMGRTEGTSFGYVSANVLVYLAATAAFTGGLIFAGGAATDSEKSMTTGMVIGGAGLAGLAIGIPLAILTRPAHQPGATTEMAINK